MIQYVVSMQPPKNKKQKYRWLHSIGSNTECSAVSAPKKIMPAMLAFDVSILFQDLAREFL